MDPRVREHAAVVVSHATDVGTGDAVDVVAPSEAEDLVVALHEKFGARGAVPDLHWDSARVNRAYARALDPDDAATPPHRLAAAEETDVTVVVDGGGNDAEASDVPVRVRAALERAGEPVEEAVEETRWCLTAYPTATAAQRAGMSTEAYEDFVWNAVTLDWDAQRALQEPMVEALDGADEVRVVADDRTDVTFSVAGMRPLSDDGRRNLPGGEVFTAPVPDSVEGVIHFDVPAVVNGREVADAVIELRDGVVSDVDARVGADALDEVLETDSGARRLGEFGVGMNRAIDRCTGDVLFDEKMGDTVHFALGEAIEPCVPDPAQYNDSVVHEDLLVDVSEDAFIEVDGDVVQRDGVFRWEDGFEE